MSFRLIVIDDDEVDRYLVRRTARKWDRSVVVDEIGSAREALDRFTADPTGEPDGCEEPPVILLDINMPGMNGFELLEKLGRRVADLHDVPPVVLMLTSSSNTRDRARAEGVPLVTDFIVKPLTPSDLDHIATLRAARSAVISQGPAAR